jgi:hypothetical protein
LRKKNYGKRNWGKNTGKNVREKKLRGEKSKGKSHVTSGDVTSARTFSHFFPRTFSNYFYPVLFSRTFSNVAMFEIQRFKISVSYFSRTCRYNTVHVPCGISIQTSPVGLPWKGGVLGCAIWWDQQWISSALSISFDFNLLSNRPEIATSDWFNFQWYDWLVL